MSAGGCNSARLRGARPSNAIGRASAPVRRPCARRRSMTALRRLTRIRCRRPPDLEKIYPSSEQWEDEQVRRRRALVGPFCSRAGSFDLSVRQSRRARAGTTRASLSYPWFMTALPTSVAATRALLASGGYLADEALSTAVLLALKLERPLLLEGEDGVGKTEIAKVLAAVLGRQLVRLQCYEGLDIASAVYEWDYPRQLLHVRAAEAEGRAVGGLYDERFLLERPLLRAVRAADGAVLLIDEIDRSDSEFEAFLLEFLSDFQITIPEIGTVRAAAPPVVVITSNRTRELHDALKR